MRSRLFVFVSIVQAILFSAHWFVYATMAHFWGGIAASWRVKLAFALLSMSFVPASLLGWYSYKPVVRFFYLIRGALAGVCQLLSGGLNCQLDHLWRERRYGFRLACGMDRQCCLYSRSCGWTLWIAQCGVAARGTHFSRTPQLASAVARTNSGAGQRSSSRTCA